MKRKKFIVIPILLVVAAGAAYYFGVYRAEKNNKTIKTSGYIEVTDVDMSFRVSGHVLKLLVDEGDQLKAGQLIAELETDVLGPRRDQAKAGLEQLKASRASLELSIQIREEIVEQDISQANSAVAAAEARYQTLLNGSRDQEIKAAAAARDQARATAVNQEQDYQRQKKLYEHKVISASQFDAASAAMLASAASLKAAQENYDLVLTGPRPEAIDEGKANLEQVKSAYRAALSGRKDVERMKLDLKALDAQVEQAKANLAVAESDLANASLTSPFNGFVTVKDVEQNEYVQAGAPVLTLANLDSVWARTYIPETELGRVRLGQKGFIETDTFPGKKYPGVVTYISPEAEFTPKNVQTKEERIKLVFRIKVTVNNPKQELKPGMPVDVILEES